MVVEEKEDERESSRASGRGNEGSRELFKRSLDPEFENAGYLRVVIRARFQL